jgi:anti-anti-sigma factor
VHTDLRSHMPPLAALRVTIESLEDACVIRAAGDLEASSLERLRASLDAARSDRRTTLLDLSGIDYIDSAGLGLLLAAAWAADDEEWAWFLVRPSDPVLRLVELTETAGLLPLVVPSLEDKGAVDPARRRRRSGRAGTRFTARHAGH